MPRAFDRGVPPVDKNPLISGTNYSDPQGIIGDAAGFFGQQLRTGIPTVIKDVTGIDITGVVEFMDWLVAQFGELFNLENWVDILQPILDLFDQLIADVGTDTFPIISELVTFLSGLFDGAGSILAWLEGIAPFTLSEVLGQFETFLLAITNRTLWLTTLQTLIDALSNIANFPSWVTVLKQVIDFFLGITSRTAWLEVFKKIVDFFTSVTSIDAWLTVFKKVIDAFVGVTGIDNWLNVFTDVIDFFVTLITSLGSGVFTLIQEIVEFFDGIFDGTDSVKNWLADIPANLTSVIQTITNKTITSFEDGLAKLTQFTQSLPEAGSLINGILGNWRNPATGIIGPNNTFPELAAWASSLLTSASVVPSWNLFGSLPEELLALIGAGSVSNVQPNLVNDASFSSAAAFQAGQGWSWDGATNSTGSTGGSAKLTCDGGVRYLYSNLIPAAPGQQLTVSSNVKYTKASSAQATIICGVRTYNGETVLATSTVAQLAATGTSGGFTAISGVFTVPASTTHVRMVLGVTIGTAGTVVWFDEVSLKKASSIPQTLVGGLDSTLSTLLPAGTFNTLLNAVASKTGATIAEVTSVINGKLDPNSSLNGNKILQGNISSAFISELLSTWGTIKQAVDKGDAPTNPTYLDPANALAGWGQNLVGLQSNVGELISSINAAVAAANGVALRATNLENRTAELERKLSVPIVPPVTPPPVIMAFDDFERSSLGASWTVSYSGSNGSTLGIPDSHNAQYSNPAVTSVENRTAAIWAGAGSVSASEYQKIYTTLGSRAGVPSVGTVGFNDLIGRAASGQRCLVARFFGNGQVQFLYRLNSWTDVNIGTFSIAIPPTTGTGLEFYCGDKNNLFGRGADQTALYAKIGTAVIGPAYVSPSVLASMGKGWGFGMGHGLSGVAPQSAGILYSWGAQEQV